MRIKPKISVLMSVFNGGRYLSRAIDSILDQTISDFEFLIINDGSIDNTGEILAHYASLDHRIKIQENEGNVGLTRSLNRGLEIAQGEFIARMDADDISLPKRFVLQLAHMEHHSEIGVLGTNIAYIDANGRAMNGGRPKDNRLHSPNTIKWELLWRCPIYHPTVMMRRSVLEQTRLNYDPQFDSAQDRDLWCRLSEHTEIASLPQVTLQYRIVPTSVSRAQGDNQRAMTHKITRRELTTLLGSVHSQEGLETLIGVFSRHDPTVVRDFAAASEILLEAHRCFCEQPLSSTDRKQIQTDVADRLISVAQEASKYSPPLGRSLLRSLLSLPTPYFLSPRIAGRILKLALARNPKTNLARHLTP